MPGAEAERSGVLCDACLSFVSKDVRERGKGDKRGRK